MIAWPDMRTDYGEVRLNAIGEANGKILRVTYTVRGEVGADHHGLAGKPERPTAMADQKLTRMTPEEIEAQIGQRDPQTAATASKRYDETTEEDIRRQMREDGYDPDEECPADALLTVPVKLVREKLGMTQAELATLLRVPLGTLRNLRSEKKTLRVWSRSRGRGQNRRAGSSGRGSCWPIVPNRRPTRWQKRSA